MSSADDFLPSEVINIRRAKQLLLIKLNEFNMTLTKLGGTHRIGYFVSGGCFASLLQEEEPKDIDIWFFSQFVADRVVELYTKDPSYMNEVAVWDEKYRDVKGHASGMMITENAVTLKDNIQLITKNYGEPQEVRQTFDFVHCMPYYDSRNDKLYISREQYNCCVNKCLLVNNRANVMRWREDKFRKRGYDYGQLSIN